MPLRALRSKGSPLLYRMPGSALVLMVCAVALLLTLGLSASFALRDRAAALQHAQDTAGNASLLVAEHAARLVETSDLILKQAVQLAGPADAPLPSDRAGWERYAALVRGTPYLVSIWLFDADGNPVLSTRRFPTPAMNVADRDYFVAQRAGGSEAGGNLFITALDNSRYSQESLILLSRPLAAAPGQFRGVALVAVSPRYIRDIYKSFDFDYARSITLRRTDGTVLLHETQGPDATDSAPAEAAGEPEISALRRVDSVPLTAEVAIPVSSVMERWYGQLWTYISYALAALAAVSVIGGMALQRARRERQAENALQHAYDTLEERVHQRTAELERTNGQLETAVTDKEVLLKEVQHRVKNNLQVICSLLRLQAARIDEPARRAFDESLRRIQCMSLMQELLYRSDQPARIDFADYLRQLCDGLVRSTNPTGARLTVNAPQPWSLDVDQATPLALIASELVSNALLHAFPLGHPGTITVELLPEGDEGMKMVVRDDGDGLPPDPSAAQSRANDKRQSGLGLVLVRALAQQAGAAVTIDRQPDGGPGTRFIVSVPTLSKAQTKAA
ncbi:sensor histidine kinase [Azospirillum formosense]|uniref:histidine kinase n=1 Tax=Azospirillum formosense TaxID=861533 RepID=A0ABX2KYJ9_9PROT|nr:histidine kinase dimerization/phosphoacceptor domain -containing protein [Azospirillum formosense]MBY3751965.1 sensor histidine kinase [Azospirillum formosense]NUB19934.1 sensor histidine kinase [Azospirillum formosense]